MDLSNETMIHVKDGDVEYLQFRKLLEYKDKVQHCYTLRGKNKDYAKVDNNNYKELYESLNIDYDGFTKIEHQAHSDLVEKVENVNEFHNNVDGLLTDKKGISLSLRFADCTPILFYDPVKNVIGNIHSGWKGTAQKIGQKGLLKMIKEYDCNVKDIICCIGPCIGLCHFEVGEDVKEIFENTFSYLGNLENFIKKGEKKEDGQKYFIDTTLINRMLLEEVGVLPQNIIESNICTVCNKEYMHSYRADKENAGRNTAIIGLKKVNKYANINAR